ncbi:Lysophospholipase [Paramyrothecium foliicola]|nr:Lysophospholipase [Paramyrothecium foliicola]
MLASSILFLSFLLGSSASALPHTSPEVQIRALPDSPSGNYTPIIVPCPANRPKIRSAAALSDEESDWLKLRQKAIADPLVEFLSRASIQNFDAQRFRSNGGNSGLELPRIGLAFSGGGYRALMNGAGFLSAADSRTQGLPENGGIQGLLQAATYIAGLSGGNWLVGSVYSNNFSTVQDIQSKAWKFDRDIFKGPESKGISLLNTGEYWAQVATQVAAKAEGWDTSLTDYWGRALSYQLIDDEEGGPAYTFSSIARSDPFKSGAAPFPVVVADGRAPGQKIVSINSTVFEFNPFEMGTWDPTTYAFAPLRYLGSNFSAGEIPKDGKCVEGFDQAGFVMGTSSTLFNQFLLQNLSSVTGDLPDFLNETLYNVLDALDEASNDVAQYAPNPFLDWAPSTNPSAKSFQLTLVDGGEDLQNLPLHPLIQPSRALDVVFAVDSSADTANNWPNGTALRATYERSLSPMSNGTLFPTIPDAETFVNLGLNRRPTFFGCDASNFTLKNGQSVPPLVVYIPNAPYVAASNLSTFNPKYTTELRDAVILNGFNAATQGNGTVDSEWHTCVGCAVLSRTMHRADEKLPDACNSCFSRYCWNGTVDQRPVSSYEPSFILQEMTIDSGAIMARGMNWMACVAALTLVLAMA